MSQAPAQALFERRFPGGDPNQLYSDWFKDGYLAGLEAAFDAPRSAIPLPPVGTSDHDAFRFGQHQASEDARIEKLVAVAREFAAFSEPTSFTEGEMSCC